MLQSIIRFFLDQKLVTILLAGLLIAWGLSTAPFKWDIPMLPSDPVPVDAIPDIGENQQIVYSEWMGRSPQDVEDQITYPLTSTLLGLPGVKSIRSTSMFGFSSIYIIFEDDVDYYWSRSRILEKINALPGDLLPSGVQPRLGPDATALGQVYWYTLEVLDQDGNIVPGVWDLHELRSIQDFQVKPALNATPGVSEVASVGGYVMEYQVDLDPSALRLYNISVMDVMNAIRASNADVGANTMEINQVEYLVRGLGYIRSVSDLEESVIAERNNVPIRVADVGRVNLGPAPRGERGILDRDGVEVTGGVVVARYGDNPMQVIEALKERIAQLEPGLPQRTLEDGRTVKVSIVPFYDRSVLIRETLGTLNDAIQLQILITIIVILVMVRNLRASVMISVILPVAVLMSFILMRYFGVDANIVALSGIAIAIGTLVDLGIILSENVLRHKDEASDDEPLRDIIYRASVEVAPAILTAVSTTIISFLPVFTLQAAEGKLFTPLAWTKTFALVAAVVITITMLPALAHALMGIRFKRGSEREKTTSGAVERYSLWLAVAVVSIFLTAAWLPLGVQVGLLVNLLFVAIILIIVLGAFYLFMKYYPKLLTWCLDNKLAFLSLPSFIILLGAMIWLGFPRVFGFVANAGDAVGVNVRVMSPWSYMAHTFPGLGKEFMPSLDEGAFLLMPTVMPHAGVEISREYLSRLDRLVSAIPEVETVVGKAGRAESALDPAPLSMFENVILYKSEYKTDADGRKLRFRVDDEGNFVTDESGQLIPDNRGQYYRQWRDHIRTPDDIWQEVVTATTLPGITSAPKLQPIETRLVMLQTGMRAPMGIKVYGPDLETIEAFAIELESHLKEVPSLKEASVFAERSVGKPYLEIKLDRQAMARYGIMVGEVQEVIEVAVGGMPLTTTVEGRERYNIRARFARDFRDSPEALEGILIPTMMGSQIPLGQIAEITYRRGPMMIRGEDTFLTGYVLFDRQEGVAEVTAVEDARNYLDSKINEGELVLPDGVRYVFSGSYENQVRAEQRLAFVIPLCLILILIILYFQFRSVGTAMMIFTAIAMAFSGGFLMVWLYAQPWFLDFSIFGTEMRTLFQISPVNLSVAVWVGFIALFGIATDDGVVMATYLDQTFASRATNSVEEIRAAVLEAGMKRIRPCLMTTATTLLALLPVLTSSGRGADIMIPMAIPAFGGMTVALITLFVVPVLYSWKAEMGAGSETRDARNERREAGSEVEDKGKGGGSILPLFLLLFLLLFLPLLLFVTPISATAQPLPESLWQKAVENNPKLKMYQQNLVTQGTRKQAVGAWPSLEVEAGVLTRPMEQMMGDQRFSFSVMQMIPRTAEFRLQREEIDAMSGAENAILEETLRMIRRELTEAWVERVALEQEMDLMDESLELMYQMQSVVRDRVATTASNSDWIRLEMRIIGMEDMHTAMEDKMDALDQKIWSITGDMDRTEIPLADSLSIASYRFARQVPDFDEHPAVRMFDYEAAAAAVRAEMTDLMTRPMVGVGVQYTPLKPRESMGVRTSGSDMVMPMVKVSIPTSKNKIRAASEAARSESLSSQRAREDKIAELQMQWADAISELQQAERNLITANRQRALSRELYENELTQYKTGMGNLDMILSIQESWVGYRLKSLEATMRQRMAFAKLEELQPSIIGGTNQ
jgi:Cu(I)/Ag(I) efflux system membrane protein CusA/SilA